MSIVVVLSERKIMIHTTLSNFSFWKEIVMCIIIFVPVYRTIDWYRYDIQTMYRVEKRKYYLTQSSKLHPTWLYVFDDELPVPWNDGLYILPPFVWWRISCRRFWSISLINDLIVWCLFWRDKFYLNINIYIYNICNIRVISSRFKSQTLMMNCWCCIGKNEQNYMAGFFLSLLCKLTNDRTRCWQLRWSFVINILFYVLENLISLERAHFNVSFL